jgi:hypothetical protein
MSVSLRPGSASAYRLVVTLLGADRRYLASLFTRVPGRGVLGSSYPG